MANIAGISHGEFDIFKALLTDARVNLHPPKPLRSDSRGGRRSNDIFEGELADAEAANAIIESFFSSTRVELTFAEVEHTAAQVGLAAL